MRIAAPRKMHQHFIYVLVLWLTSGSASMQRRKNLRRVGKGLDGELEGVMFRVYL